MMDEPYIPKEGDRQRNGNCDRCRSYWKDDLRLADGWDGRRIPTPFTFIRGAWLCVHCYPLMAALWEADAKLDMVTKQ